MFAVPTWDGATGIIWRQGHQVTFISINFLVFLLITAAVHFALPVRTRWAWLLAASLVFYGLSEPLFLVQILAVTGITFWFGQKIETAPTKAAKQRWLTPAILLLVGNLVVFKYTPFFNETLRSIFGLAHLGYPFPEIHWLLPLGISFYTFQLLSYLIDIFRGQKAERDAGMFAFYVMFFPKLVAGPIERAKNLLPQMHARPSFDYAQVVQGLQLLMWGAIQKVAIADRIAPFVNRVYDDPNAANGVQVAFATLLYAFQIYADFAGYTNMALGISLIFGYRLTQNFNLPYFAVSTPDFWKRWHISLTSWLTDYVYTPLTRQKKFKIKLFNLMMYSLLVTFVVSGFWHGANWTYVAWGALHGVYVVASLLFQKQRNAFAHRIKLTEWPNLHRGIKIGATFFLVCFAYILFRAGSMGDAIHMYGVLGTGWGEVGHSLRGVVQWDTNEFLLVLLGIVVLIGADILRGRMDVGARIMAASAVFRWSVRIAGTLVFAVLGAFYSGQAQFIYFRF